MAEFFSIFYKGPTATEENIRTALEKLYAENGVNVDLDGINRGENAVEKNVQLFKRFLRNINNSMLYIQYMWTTKYPVSRKSGNSRDMKKQLEAIRGIRRGRYLPDPYISHGEFVVAMLCSGFKIVLYDSNTRYCTFDCTQGAAFAEYDKIARRKNRANLSMRDYLVERGYKFEIRESEERYFKEPTSDDEWD